MRERFPRREIDNSWPFPTKIDGDLVTGISIRQLQDVRTEKLSSLTPQTPWTLLLSCQCIILWIFFFSFFYGAFYYFCSIFWEGLALQATERFNFEYFILFQYKFLSNNSSKLEGFSAVCLGLFPGKCCVWLIEFDCWIIIRTWMLLRFIFRKKTYKTRFIIIN